MPTKMKRAVSMMLAQQQLLARQLSFCLKSEAGRSLLVGRFAPNRQCSSAAKRACTASVSQEKLILSETARHGFDKTFAKASLSTSSVHRQKDGVGALGAENNDTEEDDESLMDNSAEASVGLSNPDLLRPSRDPKDRSRDIPWELSARYLRSKAYRDTYRGMLVWQPYVRNFKRQIPPPTRTTCIKFRKLITNNPCPVCRDEYLVVDYRNTELLNQFISPHTGKILDRVQTQVCRRKYVLLIKEIEKARDIGTLPHEEVHRHYDYSIYYDKEGQALPKSSSSELR